MNRKAKEQERMARRDVERVRRVLKKVVLRSQTC